MGLEISLRDRVTAKTAKIRNNYMPRFVFVFYIKYENRQPWLQKGNRERWDIVGDASLEVRVSRLIGVKQRLAAAK